MADASTELETTEYRGPRLWARILRPNRWRLWVQFALLGVFIIIIPILLTSERLLDAGRTVLIEHEEIDLSDECNLRVNEIREDMSYLARDVRRAVLGTNGIPPAEIARRIDFEVRPLPAFTRLVALPTSVRESRLRYMSGTVLGIYVCRASILEGEVDILAYRSGPNAVPSPEPGEGVRQCLVDVTNRATRPQPIYNSGLHPQSRDGAGNLSPCVIAIGGLVSGEDKKRPVVAGVIVDFSRYIDNRRRSSPRQAYIVTDPVGRIMIHPEGEVAVKGLRLQDEIPWQYPVDERGKSWFEPLANPLDQDRRLATAVHSGGARLPMIPVPGLECHYQKCHFGGMIETLIGDRERAHAAFMELNDRLGEETSRDSFLRCGVVNSGSTYIEVTHRDPARLAGVRSRITDWFGTCTGGRKPDWAMPLECKTFQGQLVPLRVDLNDQDPPPWLVVAASKEELQQDIDERFHEVRYHWVLPTLGVCSLLGILLVMLLTHSLRRLAKAARLLSADREVEVPVGGPYEVSQLAYTLHEMARRVAGHERELRERAVRYETILRAAGEGIVITNSGGVVEEANKAAGRMFGYTPEEMIGLPVAALVFDPDSLTGLDSSIPAVQGGNRSIDTMKGRRKDGTPFWLESNLKPVPLQDRVVVTCIFRDITRRKEDEARIRKMNDELEDRVRTRTAELEEAKGKLEVALRQAEAAARAKDTFVANMSHELRQPMHIIIGFTEALKDEAADLGAASILPDLDKILTAARHLLELINDILDLAKISAGRMDLSLSRFDLSRMIEEVRTLIGPLASKNSNRFVLDVSTNLGTMLADERRVRQILINLLSNAFKFTHNGTVTLGVRRIEEQGETWIRFSVADTGKGMTPEQVSRLFQRFYQADDKTTREQGGTGLGLTITQNFTELMDGQPVRVTSQVGRGSEFVVILPAEVSAVPSSVRPARPISPPVACPPVIESNRDTADSTVLVIDDDPSVRELMTRFLTKEGFHVVQAANGEAGIRLARSLQPSVITLDVMMPDRDGWWVLSRLKADPQTAEIPVVMLTIVDDRGRGFALGAADYLTKPIDWTRLNTILTRYLSSGGNGTVLVIDDEAGNRELVSRFLVREGCKVVTACDGEEGLTMFDRERPALILLDLMMPVLDGFAFLDQLERRHPGHGVPVVVVTAKELTPGDFDRLNGRVTRILEKGDLSQPATLMSAVRQRVRMNAGHRQAEIDQ